MEPEFLLLCEQDFVEAPRGRPDRRSPRPFLLLCEQDFVEAGTGAAATPTTSRPFLLLCEQDFVEAVVALREGALRT